jgi:predicted DNA-binding transcriptional regulator AlpA
MSHASHPRPTAAGSVPIRLALSVPPPEDPRPEHKRGPTLPAGLSPLLGINDLAALLSCSRRLIERMRAAGKLPRPDLKVGKMPRWKSETILRWIESGGCA